MSTTNQGKIVPNKVAPANAMPAARGEVVQKIAAVESLKNQRVLP